MSRSLRQVLWCSSFAAILTLLIHGCAQPPPARRSALSEPARPDKLSKLLQLSKVLQDTVASYGIIEGRAAELLDSKDAEGLLRLAEQRTRTQGSGDDEVIIEEKLVEGIPVEVTVGLRYYYDRLGSIRNRDIVKMVYGQSKDSGTIIENPQDIENICEALRGYTYNHVWSSQRLPYRRPDGSVRNFESLDFSRASSHGCSLGLYIHLADGSVERIDGHLHEGHMNQSRNEVVAGVLERLFEKKKQAQQPPAADGQ